MSGRRAQTQQAQSLGRHVVTIPRAGLGDARRQFSNLDSCHTGAVVNLGQLPFLGICPTWAVVLPGQLSYLGSCVPITLLLFQNLKKVGFSPPPPTWARAFSDNITLYDFFSDVIP